MATSIEHRALVEQLRSMTQKRAENPGESILKTTHPSGSDSGSDDQTQAVVTGTRYDENSEDSKKMYPKGPEGSKKIPNGTQKTDPGHNKGMHPRATGEAPEVERKYNLGDHNDPGTSHPSGKAAADFLAQASSIAQELRNLVKHSAEQGDSFIPTTTPEKAKNKKPHDEAGGGDGGGLPDGEPSEEAGKIAAEQLAEMRAHAAAELIATRGQMKAAAERDAESFVQTVTLVMDKFAAPHVLPAIQAQKQAAERAELDDTITKIALYDLLAEREGMPKFAEMCGAGGSAPMPPKAKKKDDNKKPDADGDGVPDWADEGEKEAAIRLIAKLAAENEALKKKGAAARKGGTFRKRAEEDSVDEDPSEDEEADETAESPEEGGQEASDAAEQALADMASMPAGGGAPDAEMMGMGPEMGAEGAPALSPEEEAALMALMQQEGMKESDVRSFAKVSSLLASGKLHPSKLSAAQLAFLQTCDGAVKRAGAKFQTLRSASRLRNELNLIHKGIQS
jgi:hypothetical protein